mmetsp:Transcript_167456/g.537755  ORF Transcript_167456/g.537755 Transcript_167456/m.537755 type:complete len:544 (-) Transcript_167456:118-1749(-)
MAGERGCRTLHVSANEEAIHGTHITGFSFADEIDPRLLAMRESNVRRSAVVGHVVDPAGNEAMPEVSAKPSQSHQVWEKPVEVVVAADSVLAGRRKSTDEEWVDSWRFQAVVGCCIIASIVELVLQTDDPDWPHWHLLNHFFVALFAAELALRISFHGSLFFEGSTKDRCWVILDCTLVGLGLIDSFIQIVGLTGTFVQLLRLHRVVRMLRVFRIVPRLSVFFNALIGMGSTFMLIFSMIFLLILVSAIVCTHLFGHAEFLDEGDGQLEEHIRKAIKGLFCDVRTSLFSLFRVTTQDNWISVAGPVIAASPSMKLFFVAFIVFVSWTMISVLTAVASNSMIEATSDRKEAERRLHAAKHKAFIDFLRHCFEEGDADGNGELDKEEFDMLVQQPRVLSQMKALGVELSVEELSKTWLMLDVDGSGTLTIDAFVDGLSYLQAMLSVTHFFNLDQAVKRSGIKFKKAMERLVSDLDHVRDQHKEIFAHLQEQARWKQNRKKYLEAWRKWAEKHDAVALAQAKESLVKVEEEKAKQRPLGSLPEGGD